MRVAYILPADEKRGEFELSVRGKIRQFYFFSISNAGTIIPLRNTKVTLKINSSTIIEDYSGGLEENNRIDENLFVDGATRLKIEKEKIVNKVPSSDLYFLVEYDNFDVPLLQAASTAAERDSFTKLVKEHYPKITNRPNFKV